MSTNEKNAPASVAQPTLPAAVPLTWESQAVAWLRGKAAEQAQNNERWPQHAACYPSWGERVKHAQRLADDLEREAAGSNANRATGHEGGAALAAPAPVAQVDHNLLEWAVSRWRDEVQHRPLVNNNRRPLDDSWRQVIRFAGGDPVAILGLSHDELVQANPHLFRTDPASIPRCRDDAAPAPVTQARWYCADCRRLVAPKEVTFDERHESCGRIITGDEAPAPVARLTLPEGWVPLTIEWEPGYPEDVAYGPQRMMDRLKKWLDKHFAARIAESAAPAPVAQTDIDAAVAAERERFALLAQEARRQFEHWVSQRGHAEESVMRLKVLDALAAISGSTGQDRAAPAPMARGGCDRPYELRRAATKGGGL